MTIYLRSFGGHCYKSMLLRQLILTLILALPQAKPELSGGPVHVMDTYGLWYSISTV